MGKNHKHKKKLKAEKSKVHITSKTKFLPKGQNITNTTFKIKPIVLQQQLQEKDNSLILSKRKLSVTELVLKLKHYNDTVKVEACQELKDMIKQHSVEIMETYLSSIIQTASGLIQDRERKVRRACIKLIKEILENVSTLRFSPFFNYILTNLKCAMTNIDKNVQEDSLLLLDGLLQHTAVLVAENFGNIFPNFLALISKLKSHSAFERTVTLNLESKLTSVKWRVKVLTRLYGLLGAMIGNHGRESGFNANDCQPICQRADESWFVPVYKDYSKYETSSVDFFSNNFSNRGQVLNNYTAVLVPLLYETWLEVVPEKSLKKNSSETTILNEESAAVFRCIINILHLLHEYSQSRDPDLEEARFLDHLLTNFPYGQSKRSDSEFVKDFLNLSGLNHDPNCVEENLLLCHLFFTLKLNLNAKNIKSKLNSIGSYLNKCLGSRNYLNSTNTKYFVMILREILLHNPNLWQKLGLNNLEIMESVISFCDKGNVPDNSRGDIFEILTRCSCDSFRSRNYQEWLAKLPRFLCENEVSAKLIDLILNLCKQNHKFVQEGVKKHLKSILDNLPNLKISDATNQETAKLHIVYMVFYLPDLSDGDLKTIRVFIEIHNNSNYAKYFENMLKLKFSS